MLERPGVRRFKVHAVLRNAVAIALWVMLLLGLNIVARFYFEPTYWPITMAITAACALGIVIALGLRSRTAAILGAGQVAFGVMEMGFHGYFGLAIVQGAAAHFAVMGAGTLGAVLGAMLHAPATAGVAAGPVRKSRALLRRLRALGQAHRVIADVLACVIAFIGSELAIRAIFGLQPFREGLTNYAVLSSATLGVVLGALIGMFGARLAISAIVARPDGPTAAAA